MEQQTLFKIRDLRKKDQYKIDDQYLNGYARIFGPTTTAVYNSLSRHAEFHTQEAFPSEELIAEEHGIGVKSVQRSIKQLKGANIIKVERVKRQGKWLNNLYSLVDKSEWLKPEDIKTLWRTRRHYSPKPQDIKAQSIGHYDPIKDTNSKDTHIKDNAEASSALEVFSLKDELTKLKTDSKRHIQLIGEYLEEKGVGIENKEQLKVAIKRHLRSAVDLSKFSDEQIGRATKQAVKEYPAYTLETLTKILLR